MRSARLNCVMANGQGTSVRSINKQVHGGCLKMMTMNQKRKNEAHHDSHRPRNKSSTAYQKLLKYLHWGRMGFCLNKTLRLSLIHI